MADIESTAGNVDVYRRVDLFDFGVAPLRSDLVPGIGVVIEPAALSDQAFHRITVHGTPPP